MNTGMNRLGFTPDNYRTVFHQLHAAGYHMHHMTHFANADQVNQEPTVGSQLELFNQTTQGLEGSISLANSAAILWHRNALGDWVRPGIMLYGASPTGLYADIEYAHLKPVMQLRSEIIDIQDFYQFLKINFSKKILKYPYYDTRKTFDPYYLYKDIMKLLFIRSFPYSNQITNFFIFIRKKHLNLIYNTI